MVKIVASSAFIIHCKAIINRVESFALVILRRNISGPNMFIILLTFLLLYAILTIIIILIEPIILHRSIIPRLIIRRIRNPVALTDIIIHIIILFLS